jgi:hypothetical protein
LFVRAVWALIEQNDMSPEVASVRRSARTGAPEKESTVEIWGAVILCLKPLALFGAERFYRSSLTKDAMAVPIGLKRSNVEP